MLPSSGPITIDDLNQEFTSWANQGGSLNTFRPANNAPTGWGFPSSNPPIPNSGSISLNDFYGKYAHHDKNKDGCTIIIGNLSNIMYGYSALNNPQVGNISNPSMPGGQVIIAFSSWIPGFLSSSGAIQLIIFGSFANSSSIFTQVYIEGTYLNRTQAVYSTTASTTSWQWNINNQIFAPSGAGYAVIR